MALSVPKVVERYGVVHDYRGPRMRFGAAWFAVILVAMWLGSFGVTLLFTASAALAALQAATRWAGRHADVSPAVATALPLSCGLAAYGNLRLVGLVLIIGVVASVLLGPNGRPLPLPNGPEAIQERLPMVAATLRCALAPTAVAVSVVQVHRTDSFAFLFLAAIVSVYDAGDYLIGAGYDQRAAGPVAGIVAAVAMTAAMSIIEPPPLEGNQVWLVGLTLGLLAPLGQLAASWVLPSARASAPALRRLDTWLLAAPVFMVLLWIIA